MNTKIQVATFVGALLLMAAPVSFAQNEAISSKEIGPIEVIAAQSLFHPGDAQYTKAHLKGDNGLTIDADVIDVKLASKTAVMTGNVKAHINRAAETQDITVNSDKAIYDRGKNQIDLTGNVKVTILSPYTTGPMIQTGDSAVVQLGAEPEYPLITMDHVHSTFTPAQQ